jgi:hypothetical protein
VVGVDLRASENDHQKVVERMAMVCRIATTKRREVEVAHLRTMKKRSKELS